MSKKRYSDEQIVRILDEGKSGLSIAEICRKHGCSEQSFYRWKAKFDGLDVSEVRRLRRRSGQSGPQGRGRNPGRRIWTPQEAKAIMDKPGGRPASGESGAK